MSWLWPSAKKKRWSEEELVKLITQVRTHDVKHAFHVPGTHGGHAVVPLEEVIRKICSHCGIVLDYVDYVPGTHGGLVVRDVKKAASGMLEIRVGYECVTDACRWWSLTFSECAVKRIAESLTDLSHIMNDMKNPKPLMEDGK